MKFSTQVKSISYLKRHAEEIIVEISETRRPMIVTQHGLEKIVLIDVKSYEEQKETLAFLKIMALGHREIEQGKYCLAEEMLAALN